MFVIFNFIDSYRKKVNISLFLCCRYLATGDSFRTIADSFHVGVSTVGGYGRSSDGGILANSAFGQALRSGTLHLPADLPLPGAEERGPQLHIFVADETFPLRRNMMRPFPGRLLPRERRIFKYRLSRARMVVENAFGILASQWCAQTF